jgi:hypothetical protein|tara:strand:+ start:45 stop:1166 length:1122 start_codon:yes stop_codon:yes gene_type:complete
MKSKINNLGQCSIDSLKIRIETTHLKSYNKELNKTIVSYDLKNIESGNLEEIEDLFKQKRNKYQLDGFSLYASIVENVTVGLNRKADCLMLLINSKQLSERYFEGITLNTLPVIFDLVKRLKILDCDYDTFLSSSPTDIDFKKDYELELDEYKELINGCDIMTKESNKSHFGNNVFREKTNYGIQWSKRETTKFLQAPFTKIYHKGFEFITSGKDKGSKEFADKYLSHLDFSNVLRIETQVKNKHHLNRLKIGLNDFTLKEILSLSEENKDKILSKAINSHLSRRTKSLTFKNKSNLTPSNRMHLNSLLGLIHDANFTFKRACNLLLNNIENDSSKSLKKKLLIDLYNDHIKDTNYDVKSSKVESILDGLGWF